jgi:ethanolamine transporter EutH
VTRRAQHPPLLTGALGLVAGIVVAPIGIAAAACLVAYFALAIVAHGRHRDLANIVTPIVMLVLSAIALALALALAALAAVCVGRQLERRRAMCLRSQPTIRCTRTP